MSSNNKKTKASVHATRAKFELEKAVRRLLILENDDYVPAAQAQLKYIEEQITRANYHLTKANNALTPTVEQSTTMEPVAIREESPI